MHIQDFKYPGLILASVIALAGCPSDDTGSGNSDTDQTTGPSTSSPTSPSTSATTPSTTATDTTPMTESDTETGTDTVVDTDTSSSTGPDPNEFIFRDDPFEEYVRVDRMGLPAVNTAFILTDNKDAYNADDPTARAGGSYDADMRTSLVTLHIGAPGMQTADNTGLNDDLDLLGLDQCTITAPTGETCLIDQVGPNFIAGDQIHVDTTADAGFPNGRHPSNAVIDILFALALLDLETESVTAFAELPLNPTANDVAFLDEFPYFAPPQ